MKKQADEQTMSMKMFRDFSYWQRKYVIGDEGKLKLSWHPFKPILNINQYVQNQKVTHIS